MKIKMPLLSISIIVGLFLLTACAPTEKGVVKGVFLGGELGIAAKFEAFSVQEEGVYSIYDTETFPVEVLVQNKGEYELKPGDVTVKLLGVSPDEFSGIPAWTLQNKNTILKKSELAPEGGEETISFADNAKFAGKVTGLLDRQWFANIEYNYETSVIIPEVCLKEDLKDQRVCEVKEAKTFFVSGAPLIVTSVSEESAGQGIVALRIKAVNKKGGKVTKQGEEFGIRNTFTYGMDDPAWECQSTGKVNEARLQQDGTAEIICKLKEPLAEETLQTKQVALTLKYQYQEIVQETLRIKQSEQ